MSKKSNYSDFAAFINKSHERVFNDSIMRLIIIEIKLKSCDFNEQMILPRYFSGDTTYKGEVYKKTASIEDLLSKKAVQQAKELVKNGSSINFKNTNEIRNWICDEAQINNGSLAALFE